MPEADPLDGIDELLLLDGIEELLLLDGDVVLLDDGVVALFTEEVCELVSDLDDLFLCMSPRARADVLATTMIEEKKIGASLRMGPPESGW